jgi:hypothetical protein
MNQMVAHEKQDLYWFRHMGCPSLVGGDAALLLFVSLVIGTVAPNYVVDEMKENELGSRLRGPYSPIYSLRE